MAFAIDNAIFFEVFPLWLLAAYDANEPPASWFVAVCVRSDESP
jgi:hypothetical protein